MTTFYGYELEIYLDMALVDVNGVAARAGHDYHSARWLIVAVDDDLDHLVWVCAPVSERTLRAVAAGRATVRDLVSHSATGSVEVVAVDHGRAVPDRRVVCAHIPVELLPGGAAEAVRR